MGLAQGWRISVKYSALYRACSIQDTFSSSLAASYSSFIDDSSFVLNAEWKDSISVEVSMMLTFPGRCLIWTGIEDLAISSMS